MHKILHQRNFKVTQQHFGTETPVSWWKVLCLLDPFTSRPPSNVPAATLGRYRSVDLDVESVFTYSNAPSYRNLKGAQASAKGHASTLGMSTGCPLPVTVIVNKILQVPFEIGVSVVVASNLQDRIILKII